jgi:hypothetical protein
MNKINVVCLKWGNKYDATYVNRLYSMVKRNLTIPFDFYCITEDDTGIDKNIKIKPIPNLALEGWWFKLTFFQKDAYNLKGRILFLDLDVVIVNNIDEICLTESSFSAVKEWNDSGYVQSTVFTLDINQHTYVYDNFITNHQSITKRLAGDQDWISESIDKTKMLFFPADWVVSYKWHCNSKGFKLLGNLGKLLGLWFAFGEAVLPKNAKIVAFHGKPDPEDVMDKPYLFWKKAPFVKKYWQ